MEDYTSVMRFIFSLFSVAIYCIVALECPVMSAASHQDTPAQVNDEPSLYMVPLCTLVNQHGRQGAASNASLADPSQEFGVTTDGWTRLAATCQDLGGRLRSLGDEARGRAAQSSLSDAHVKEYDKRFHALLLSSFDQLQRSLSPSDFRAIRGHIEALRANTTGRRLGR